MKEAIRKCEVACCLNAKCSGYVKPDIVFFGEALPENFHRNRSLPSIADLAIVMGTSLSVHPFANLPGMCSDGVPRVLINSERVGGLGSRTDDVLLLGDCDESVRKLASSLGWSEELELLWETSNPTQASNQRHRANESKDQAIDAEVIKITEEVERSLKISNEHSASLRKELSPQPDKGSHSDDTSLLAQGSSMKARASETAESNRSSPES